MTDFDRTAHDPARAADPTIDTDTTATPIATNPIGAPPADGVPATIAPAPRRTRVRWFAAAGIVALVVGASAIATLMLTGSSPAATVLGYVPADSVMYGEVRLDLPGDQRQKVGAFLARFPGFADQAALDAKLDEVLDRLVSDGTDGEQTYSRDIAPWFGGEMAFSVGALPTSGDPAKAAAETRALLLLSIKDEALARTWFGGVIAKTGASTSTQDYQGVQLTVFDDLERVGSTADAAFALVGGKVAIAGDLTSVKAAIDTKGAGGLAGDAAFTAARAAASGDHIGFVFLDTQSLIDAAMSMTEGLASAPPINSALLGLIPEWTAMRLRVEGDALVMDAMAPHVDAAPGPATNHANGVAGYAPPSTIVLAAGNDAGATLLETIALYRGDPTLAEVFSGIDQAAGMLGGLDASLGWMGDTGIVIARTGDTLEGGLVSIPADPAGGKQLLTTLRSFIQLGGGQLGFDVRDEDYNGTSITILDLGTATDLAALAGGMGGVPIDPGTSLPEGNVEIAFATTDGVVVIGSSPDFVRHVLDAGAGASLADDERFQNLVGRVGPEHTGISFLDITAVRELVEGLLAEATAEQRAEYEESIKPFLTPFDAVIGSSVTGSDLDQHHLVITAR